MEASSESPEHLPPEHALCMQGGLCCNGTFYGSVVVAAGERARLERVGLRVIASGDKQSMPQPCTALRGSLCSAYADRPAACASYECSLRKRVTAGECTLDEALAQVSRMHALLGAIRAAFEVPATASIWERILALETPAPADESALADKYGAAVEAVGELLELGRARFEPRFAGGGAQDGTASGAD